MRVLRIDPAIQRGDGKVSGRRLTGQAADKPPMSSREMHLSWRFPPGTPVMDQRVHRDFSPIDTIPPRAAARKISGLPTTHF